VEVAREGKGAVVPRAERLTCDLGRNRVGDPAEVEAHAIDILHWRNGVLRHRGPVKLRELLELLEPGLVAHREVRGDSLPSVDTGTLESMAVLEALRPALLDQHAGQTIVIDLRVEVQPDSSGDDALFVTLVLQDPPSGDGTWPVEDLRALRDLVRGALAEQDIPMAWYVVFEPAHPDLDEDDALFRA
jgi:hypothetical protein